MLKENFQYYLDNQDELVKMYDNLYLLIVNKQVVKTFDTDIDAVTFGETQYEPGTFLVQKCTKDTKDYSQTFHSRVQFV